MSTKKYLKILKEEIHSVVIATVDKDGLPVARVIDIMLTDEKSLYFITARGKEFYNQLMDKGFVAISGMTSEGSSLNKKAISIRGKAENIGNSLLNKVFKENPYMSEIYPSEESRFALEVFRLSEGTGEYFDLSTKPITRNSFTISIENKLVEANEHGYFILENCIGCKECIKVCPQNCINDSNVPFLINRENCLHCGNCITNCKFNAVEKK